MRYPVGGPTSATPKPTKAELEAAKGQTIPDVIAPGLDVLFCGINPSLYSAAVGHHFARPGNRFWRALHAAGFTDRLLSPFEDGTLVRLGLGLTNLVPRATASAAEISPEEFRTGAKALAEKLHHFGPGVLSILGVTAYRLGFESPDATVGLQKSRVDDTPVWVLPNPSGLNAHYQIDDIAALLRELRSYVESRAT